MKARAYIRLNYFSILFFYLAAILNAIIGDVSTAITFTLIATGSILNLVAIKANGDKMPAVATVESELHCLITEKTRFRILTDIIRFGNYYYSIGDLVAFSGVLVALFGIVSLF